MARLFTAASNEYAKTANAVASVVPLSMACWVRLAAVGTVARIIMEIRNSASVTGRNCWSLRMSDTEKVRALTADASAASFNDTTASLVAGEWAHVAAVFEDASHRVPYLNGTAGANTTSAKTPVGPNVTDIGIAEISSGSLSLPWGGDIFMPAAWAGVALTADDIAALAAGYAPWCVRPDALVFAPPFHGNASPEPDPVGRFDLTLVGTSKTADPPRIIQPRRSRIYAAPAAVVGGRMLWHPGMEGGMRSLTGGING